MITKVSSQKNSKPLNSHKTALSDKTFEYGYQVV